MAWTNPSVSLEPRCESTMARRRWSGAVSARRKACGRSRPPGAAGVTGKTISRAQN